MALLAQGDALRMHHGLSPLGEQCDYRHLSIQRVRLGELPLDYLQRTGREHWLLLKKEIQ